MALTDKGRGSNGLGRLDRGGAERDRVSLRRTVNCTTFLPDAASHSGADQVKGQKQVIPGSARPLQTQISSVLVFVEACVTVVVAAMTSVSGLVCWT
ncbi:hypothetical protein E2C01_053830 [Portunus trituberculatus]|uniref:Uncharacterized protein n=1 Tax=Portunus trituberculatus TaxID=210409 RepID=A0A5B7GLD6_PORTR|nr:hypothetical protein [Portunus trituberculatus]